MTALDWPGCRNARDVGGLPTVDGLVVRAAALYRSDGLFRLSEAGVAAVRAAALARIVDLRWQYEVESDPGPFAGDANYRHVPMLEDVLGYEVRHDTYGPMLDHNRSRIADAFRALASAPEQGAVVVHCHGGRDRTGVLVALALSVTGVPAAEIVDDYGRSPDGLPITMTNTLAHLDERYGGAEPYLRRIGIAASEIAAVRRRLVGRPKQFG
ncbi:tyrosine-protein phosphatase [Actinoplanes sp. KI2]|uniref:tyrosine-protein phosphatase n=1 Tax=Actinoplanes sp. KI2 TaxID=2983315 RepID=UPI0021D5C30F|nr:tyrosine-protein phosphatase [Actinoplanes sp. KI2]MCU7728625.1 tyrosine-protein phosphatase [Actinoplanes sp. KI2]